MTAKPAALTIALADIDVSDRVQPLDEAKAQEIAVSFGAHGRLINRIGLRHTPKGRKKWVLVHGRHRLRGLEIAGLETLIEGEHFERLAVDAEQARLLEIEENMARTDVSPFGRAIMLVAYREATGIEGRGAHKKAADPARQAQLDALREGFTAHAMRVFDLSPDQLSRLLQIGTRLSKPEGLVERLHFSRIARNQSQLLKLSALPEEQLANAAEAFDAAKGDFFNLMTILTQPVEGQSAVLAKLRAGASLDDIGGPAKQEQAPPFDHWQQAVSAFDQLDFKGRVTATVEHFKRDEKAVRAAFQTLGYDLVQLEGKR
jgi:hypothetical protein